MALTGRRPTPALALLLASASLTAPGHARLAAGGSEAHPEELDQQQQQGHRLQHLGPAAAAAAGSQRNRKKHRGTSLASFGRTPTLEIGDDENDVAWQQQQRSYGDGNHVEEPPAIANVSLEDVDLCSRQSPSEYETGDVCGPPFSEPCFDRTRCAGLSVYVYDQECSLADSQDLPNRNHKHDDAQHQSSYWRSALSKVGMLAETYEEACLFIHVNTHNHDEPCATRAPLWNDGSNHVMMEFTPWWQYNKGRPRMGNTYAMDWAFDLHTCHYRSGYDLSLPLKPKVLFHKLADVPAIKRKFFLTFKGALYIGGFGVEERAAASRLHDPSNGVVSVVKCFEMHGEHLLPENKDYCRRAKKMYGRYEYGNLMNATFALVPAGRSPGTFRLGEVMSAGSIPVFIVRDWVRPYEEQVDWDSFSFMFSPDDTGAEIMEVLRGVDEHQLMTMQRKSLETYWKMFGGAADYSVIAKKSVAEIVRRFEGLGLNGDHAI